MMYGFGTHGVGIMLGWIVGLALLIFVIWIIVRAVNSNSGIDNPRNRTSLDILKERYAKGEIDKEEFEEKKRDLTS